MFKCLNNKGFTLVEMLVAISIFVIVVTIISGLFVHAIQGQRRNLAYQELLDQTSYVMEYMSRSIRMAMKDDIEIWGYPVPPPNCLADDKANYEYTNQCLIFRNYKNECQFFCLEGTKLTAATTTTGGGFIPPPSTTLTSSELEVYPLGGVGTPWIDLSGEGQGDNLQPLVVIGLEIEGRENTRIRIQTSVSQRNLDVRK